MNKPLYLLLNFLVVSTLVFEPALAQTGNGGNGNSTVNAAVPGAQQVAQQTSDLRGVSIRQHPTQPNTIQILKKSDQPGQPPLELDVSFDEHGSPLISIGGSKPVSVEQEQNNLKTSLFDHEPLVQKLAQNASAKNSPTSLTDDDVKEISGIFAPIVESIWNKFQQPGKVKQIAGKVGTAVGGAVGGLVQLSQAYGGKIGVKIIIALACISMVAMPLATALAYQVATPINYLETFLIEGISFAVFKGFRKFYARTYCQTNTEKVK